MPTLMAKRQLQTPSARQRLINEVFANVGPQNVRVFYLPDPNEGTIAQDKAVPTRQWTHSAAPAASRYTRLGNGYGISFDGATQFITAPDANDLSFGNAVTDSPFSVFAVHNVTDTASARSIIGKWNATGTAREWLLDVAATDVYGFDAFDESVTANPVLTSNAAATQGSIVSVAGTYSAATGGATAANDMLMYENGALRASTPTNAGTYVAMENTAALVQIGARNAGAGSFYQGSLYLVLVSAAALTAAQVGALHIAVQRYLRF